MMGFGSYGGNGGSSLSALAQPFTVDRPITKPPTTPLVDLAEPSFNPSMASSLQNWANSFRPDYFSELDSMPSTKPYHHSGPNPFNQPQSAPSPSLDPIAIASNDAFSYNPNPDCVKNDFGEVEPYYPPPYVLPSVQFSTPHVSTFTGSAPDQRLSGFEHTTQWGGLWEGLPDWGHGKKVDVGGSFYPNEMNVASPFISEDHLDLGAKESKGVNTFEETTLGTCMISREKQVESANTGKLDYVPVLGQTASSMSTLGVPDLQITLGNPVKLKKNLVPFSNPYGNFNRELGTSTDSPSTGLVIKPPAFGSSSSVSITVPFKNVNTVSDATNIDSTHVNPSSMKEPCPLLGPAGRLHFDPNQMNIYHDGNFHLSAELSSGKSEELLTNKIGSMDVSDQFCVRSRVQFSHVSSNGFNTTTDNDVEIQVENSSESSDHYNPADDSPCWKGAPISLYSPFGSSGAVATELLKKPEACSESNRKVGSNLGRPICGSGFEFSDNINQLRKEYFLSNKSINESDLKPSCTVHQSLEEENSPCPPSSGEDIPATRVDSHGKESSQMINVHVLIGTMHNLSELLLFHCSNEENELKKQEFEALKNVIRNLDKCMPKNVGRKLSADPNKGKSKGNPPPEAVLGDPRHSHVLEKRKQSREKDGESSDFLLVRDHAEIKVKDDKNHKMTLAIKKVLSENFHEKEEIHPEILLYKNLWLEAEAALCSINYMARYNRMKMEMEQYKLGSAKVSSEDATDEEKISKISSYIKTDEKSTPASRGGSSTEVLVPDSPIISTSTNANDVIVRLNILKSRLENLNSNDAVDEEKISSPKVCSKMVKVDKLDPEVTYSQISELSSQDDIEASVMSRLHILKSRVDNSSSMDMELQPLQRGVDLGYAGQIKQWCINNDGAEDGMSDENVEPVKLHEVANHAGDTVKEFHLQVKHDSIGHSPQTNRLGNQLSTSCHDNSSSDWEHVLKEELSGQNRSS